MSRLGRLRLRMKASIRLARLSDVSALRDLIERSARGLGPPYYDDAQTEAALAHVFGVDTQIIEDQTYYVIEADHSLTACGGWSRRSPLFGGDQTKKGPDSLLDPVTDAARIRAFFVDPAAARRGLGRLLLNRCADEARRAGFRELELVSTLPGEPLYLSSGFSVVERFALDLPENVSLPLVRMRRRL